MRSFSWLASAAPIVLLVAAKAALGAELPAYRPETSISGVLRTRGSDAMATLLANWAEGFRRFHPGVAFENVLKGNASAMIGLEESTADMVAMTRRIVPYDTYGVWRRSHRVPIEITVAMGSFDVPHKAPALAIFVHKDSPITRLTLKDLDGIFGAQRTGGWNGMRWDPGAARSEAEDIRTWGQLGARGDWAHAPIRPYGPPGLFPGGMSFFQMRVLGGADTRAERLLEFSDPAQRMSALSRDRRGIGYASVAYRTPELKVLALAAGRGEPFVELTRENVQTGRYPLARSIHIYLPPDAANGDPLVPAIAPKVREFLRYVLSRDGQRDVVREGDFLPLEASTALEQLRKLDAETNPRRP